MPLPRLCHTPPLDQQPCPFPPTPHSLVERMVQTRCLQQETGGNDGGGGADGRRSRKRSVSFALDTVGGEQSGVGKGQTGEPTAVILARLHCVVPALCRSLTRPRTSVNANRLQKWHERCLRAPA